MLGLLAGARENDEPSTSVAEMNGKSPNLLYSQDRRLAS